MSVVGCRCAETGGRHTAKLAEAANHRQVSNSSLKRAMVAAEKLAQGPPPSRTTTTTLKALARKRAHAAKRERRASTPLLENGWERPCLPLPSNGGEGVRNRRRQII